MQLRALQISGAFEVIPQLLEDERGFFARVSDVDILQNAGLRPYFAQESVALNVKAGTVRGLHYQAVPHWETKIVSCFAGQVFDAILDLRRESATFGQWTAVVLDARRCNAVYIPEGCAHGYQTLQDESILHYKIAPAYVPALSRGINPFDADIGIQWPLTPVSVSQRDLLHPSLQAYACESS